MSEYQVIARKWRPQRFSDVVGQEHVVQTLSNAIRQNRTAHAYLFVGPRGVGKTTLARIFAKGMNCLEPRDGDPCCECASCRAIAADSSLDVIEIDAASRNSASDMRELAEDVLHQPVAGRYKIYIIDEVHMLTAQAWNALLKTVEEPPAHAKFIFATTEVHKVLKTIISRCQRFDLLPIPTRLIAERLRLIAAREKVAVNDDAVNAIARAAEGGMRDAQSLLDQMIAFFAQGDGSAITGDQVLSLFGLTDRADLDAILTAMLRDQPGEVVRLIGGLARRGKNLETLFDDLLDALRGVQLSTLLPDPGELLDVGPEAVKHYQELARLARPDTVQILLETIAPVGRVLHDALNKQVYLETILLKAMREAHAVRLNDVIARLNQLRTAGELKFLDQLPAGKVPVAPTATVATGEPVSAGEPVLPVPPAKAADPVSSVAPVTTTFAASESPADSAGALPQKAGEYPADPSPAAVEEPTVDVPPAPYGVQEKPSPEAPPISTADQVKASLVADPLTARISALDSELSINPGADSGPMPAGFPVPESAPPHVPASDVSAAGLQVLIEEEAELDCDGNPAEIIPAELEAPPIPEVSQEDVLAPEQTGRKKRRSIANDQPGALESALQDPLVREIVDLFDGRVVDIHKPEED